MNLRRSTSVLLSLSALLALSAHAFADDEKEIKFGTLAPKSSPWGKVFQIWGDAVAEKSNGNMKITFYWNGVQGDEKAMVEKMLGGSQLDGVACTAVGLSKIWKPILLLQTPGFFRSWGALDKARDSIKDKATAGFAEKKIVNLGWGDVGVAHIMSKGFEVRGPESIHGHSPYFWADDPMAPKFFEAIKEVAGDTKKDFSITPKGKQVPEVLGSLKSGEVDLLNAPALAAAQLQWAPQITNLVKQPSGIGIGALVVKQDTLDGLSEDQRKLLKDTGAVAASDLTGRIRKADKHAFEKMSKDKTVIDLSEDEKNLWEKVFKKTQEKLKADTAFDGSLLDSLAAFKG